MKTTAFAALVILAGTGAGAAETKPPADIVPICTVRSAEYRPFLQAQSLAAEMFAGIGIRIEWLDARHCPAGALQITLSSDVPQGYAPDALAYALPYQGTHIVIFYERVRQIFESWNPQSPIASRRLPVVLAHVLAHEVTHILENVNHHSQEGVMKAYWTEDDYNRMLWKPLPFAQADVELIYLGLEARKSRTRIGSGPSQ
jgi:hypothetical protein